MRIGRLRIAIQRLNVSQNPFNDRKKEKKINKNPGQIRRRRNLRNLIGDGSNVPPMVVVYAYDRRYTAAVREVLARLYILRRSLMETMGSRKALICKTAMCQWKCPMKQHSTLFPYSEEPLGNALYPLRDIRIGDSGLPNLEKWVHDHLLRIGIRQTLKKMKKKERWPIDVP